MDLLQGLQAIMGQASSGPQRPQQQSGAADTSGLGGLSELLNPSMLSGLVGSLLGGSGGGQTSGAAAGGGMGGLGGLGAIGGLLSSFLGGGSSALDTHAQSMDQVVPQFSQPAADAKGRVTRMIRAMIYAAKADGHIDQSEQAAITQQLQKLQLGPEGQALIQQAVNEPINPNAVASGVKNSQEAVQLYALSRAVINVDTPNERKYLDDLARALRIPADIQQSIEGQLRG